MIPGLSMEVEALLARALDKRATSVTAETIGALPCHVFGPDDAELQTLGIRSSGHPDLTIAVTDPKRRIGQVSIEAASGGGLLFIDNRQAEGAMHANLRMLGRGSAMLFMGLGAGYIALHDVFLRSDSQLLFWGAGSTSVGASIELEGSGRYGLIGDDALLSAGIWIRNHDMHAIHDLDSGARINADPVDVVLERHVWLGQSAMLHGCARVGMGSIIGAGAFVKGEVASHVAIAGVPARVVRERVSWGRDMAGMTPQERSSLGLAPL